MTVVTCYMLKMATQCHFETLTKFSSVIAELLNPESDPEVNSCYGSNPLDPESDPEIY